MKDKIYSVIAKSLKIEESELNGDLGPGDIPQWDSLAHQGLILSLEKEFNTTFDIDEVLEMETVEDIVEIIEAKEKEAA